MLRTTIYVHHKKQQRYFWYPVWWLQASLKEDLIWTRQWNQLNRIEVSYSRNNLFLVSGYLMSIFEMFRLKCLGNVWGYTYDYASCLRWMPYKKTLIDSMTHRMLHLHLKSQICEDIGKRWTATTLRKLHLSSAFRAAQAFPRSSEGTTVTEQGVTRFVSRFSKMGAILFKPYCLHCRISFWSNLHNLPAIRIEVEPNQFRSELAQDLNLIDPRFADSGMHR